MKFSNEIIKILDDLGKRIGFAIDWSNKNVMPYLEELMRRFITWEIATSIIWIVLGVVMTSLGGALARHIWKNRDSYDYFGDPDEGITWLFILCLVLLVAGIPVVITQCFDICRAVYLPEDTYQDDFPHPVPFRSGHLLQG